MAPDLADRALDPLPLGSVEPRGWLRRQLRVQADGLTGHLDEFWPDLADNQWLGGENDGWERGPYYADGLVPLAHLLDDEDLQAKAEKWVEGFLDGQDSEGWIGPAKQAQDQGYDYDPWPRFVVLKVLRQHYEATGEDRALDAMVEFCRYLNHALDNKPLDGWGEFRWADLVVSAHWLHERTGEDFLLDLAAKAHEQGYDWNDHFDGLHGHQRPQDIEDYGLSSHVVNNAMGLKSPAVWYRQSGDDEDRTGTERAIDNLDLFHGQATGVFTGDEHFGGKHPARGTELCAVVEYMYSLEEAVSVLGDADLADRLERITFNALPATFTPDMWAHQYDQQANQVLCSVHDRHWSNGPDANVFGLEPNFGCCTANYHQGWPKYAASLWMRRDDGLAAVSYAPSAVTTEVGDGTEVTVTAETDYPFGDTVELTVETDEPVTFPLALRIPSWTEDAAVERPDSDTDFPEAGGFHVVEREWTDGDTVELSLPADVTVERRHAGAVAVGRGPLTFSLPLDAERRQVRGEQPHADYEFYPTEAWNYGLDVDPDDPDADVEFDAPGEVPFATDDAPAELTLYGRRVPEWTLDEDNAWADTVPASPVDSDEEREELTLVPYGATNLRVTEFPLLLD